MQPERAKAERASANDRRPRRSSTASAFTSPLGPIPMTAPSSKIGHFFCIDITKKGDVSAETRISIRKIPANKESALVWHYGGIIQPPPAKGRPVRFGRTPQHRRRPRRPDLHCGGSGLSAMPGRQNRPAILGTRFQERAFWARPTGWTAEFTWARATASARFSRTARSTRCRAASTCEALESTPVVANGVLYIGTETKIYAIAGK